MKARFLPPILPAAALLAAVLMLAACGGGGGASRTPSDPGPGTGEPPPGDGAGGGTNGTGGLSGRTDTLLSTGFHSSLTLTAGEVAFDNEPLAVAVDCAGARCTDETGDAVTAAGLFAAATGNPGAALGTRGGFDTVETTADQGAGAPIDGVEAAGVSTTSWGFWGEHGFAAVTVSTGALSGAIDGTAIEDGSFRLTSAWALGDGAGTNPVGTGRATWRGLAEAASKATFERSHGTATVTIPDLAQPLVDVTIDIPGQDIGEAGWTGMALTAGGFKSGTAGADYLEGKLHGPNHEEAWGVFDTTDHVGAFGAKRDR